MSGGKTKSNSRTSTTNTLSPWSQSQWETLSGGIQGGIDTFRSGITPYTGQLTAGLSDEETRAGALINSSTGNWTGALGDLNGMLGEDNFTRMAPRTFADFNADTYVNPHADEMIRRTTGDLTEAADRARTASTAQTLTNGAYGGSRHGVRDALLDESLLDAVGDASSGIRFDTWNRGADNFYRDVDNEMSATGYNNDLQFQRTQGLADLLQLGRGFEQQDIDRLMGFGATARGVEDRGLAAQYADYLRMREEERAALGLDFGLLGSVPMLVNSTGTSEETTRTNPGALGIAGALLGGAGSMFGANGMFGAGGFFGRPSGP